MTISRIWSVLPTQRWKASLQCGAVVSCLPLVLADCVPVCHSAPCASQCKGLDIGA